MMFTSSFFCPQCDWITFNWLKMLEHILNLFWVDWQTIRHGKSIVIINNNKYISHRWCHPCVRRWRWREKLGRCSSAFSNDFSMLLEDSFIRDISKFINLLIFIDQYDKHQFMCWCRQWEEEEEEGKKRIKQERRTCIIINIDEIVFSSNSICWSSGRISCLFSQQSTVYFDHQHHHVWVCSGEDERKIINVQFWI